MKTKYLEHQTLGRRVICPSKPANQRIILQIVGFLYVRTAQVGCKLLVRGAGHQRLLPFQRLLLASATGARARRILRCRRTTREPHHAVRRLQLLAGSGTARARRILRCSRTTRLTARWAAAAYNRQLAVPRRGGGARVGRRQCCRESQNSRVKAATSSQGHHGLACA